MIQLNCKDILYYRRKLMKKKILLSLALSLILVCFFVISISASAPAKPELDVSFGDVSLIDGFVAPSELFVNTDERVLLVDENGNYVTYPTYYVTSDSETFDMDFSKLNAAQAIQYNNFRLLFCRHRQLPTLCIGSIPGFSNHLRFFNVPN